jgi:hypothetical protein
MMSVIINDPALAEVWKLVEAEVARAESLHPNYPPSTDPVRRVGIIVEEVGETMQAALDLSRSSDHSHHDLINAYSRLLTEGVHAAAMCVKMLKEMMKEEMCLTRF